MLRKRHIHGIGFVMAAVILLSGCAAPMPAADGAAAASAQSESAADESSAPGSTAGAAEGSSESGNSSESGASSASSQSGASGKAANTPGGTSSLPSSSSVAGSGKKIEIVAKDVAFHHMNSGDTRTTTITVTPPDCKLTLTTEGDAASWTLSGNQLTVTMKQNPKGIPGATITATKDGYQSAECYVNAYSLESTPVGENDDHQPVVDELVRRINLLRKASGLSELKQSQALNDAATTRAGEMTQGNWETRYGLGSSWTTALDEAGFAYRAADQHVMANKNYVPQMIDAVDDSAMMSDSRYDSVGIGFKRSPYYGNQLVCTIIFAESMPAGSQVDPYIELDQQSVEMKVGDKLTVKAQLLPAGSGHNEQLKWVSQDKSVVTVSSNNRSGYLQAKAPGTTEIVVLTEKSGITAYCTVVVVGEEEPEPEQDTDTGGGNTDSAGTTGGEIVMSHSNITLRIGESKRLSAKITPAAAGKGNTFSWQVYNGGEFAEISDDGTVTAVAEGVAYVACYSSISGINWNLCTVTVIP